MKHFTPTYGAGETAVNTRQFLKNNMDAFWDIWKPLIPYVFGLYILDIVVTEMYFMDSKNEFSLGAIISSYFMTVLVISWHRVVIHGADRYEPMKPMAPKKHEWGYIGMALLIGVGIVIAAAILGGVVFALAGVGQKALLPFIMLVGIWALIYYSFRCSFYFPAKAIGSNLKLGEAFKLSKGYFWKMAGAGFLASWRYILLCLAAVVAMLVVIMVAMVAMGMSPETMQNMESNQADAMPLRLIAYTGYAVIVLYLQPLLTVIGVTVLSNYFQHSLHSHANVNAAISERETDE